LKGRKRFNSTGQNSRCPFGAQRKKMEQIALYKDFRIRAYQDWSGQWLAEAKRPPASSYSPRLTAASLAPAV
jgi:hypothetical protein